MTSYPTGNIDPWEAAYLRFETPEQEIRKFTRRLVKLGADQWPRDAAIVELFCGRGNGLNALERLGFRQLEGIDISAALLAEYAGSARCYTADCRQLPFEENTKDILIVQGGLHHLPVLPDDLEQTVREARRVLRDGGCFVVVEPWQTSFLSFVHAVCRSHIRRWSNKVDALATMIEHEQQTYFQWLRQPQVILRILENNFKVEHCSIAWGKMMFRGRKSKAAGE